MQEVVSSDERVGRGASWRARLSRRGWLPSSRGCAAALASALLLVLAFPDFGLWWLAWVALAPLMIAVAREPGFTRGFILGWVIGATYFYGSCYWATYPMIHYAGIPAPIAYLLLAPATLILGFFPALACGVLGRAVERWGARALFALAPLWAGGEWLRLEVTGQLWNALGYTQAFEPWMIQAARWGGVYAVSFLIVLTSAAVAYYFVAQNRSRYVLTPAALLLTALVLWASAVPNYSSVELSDGKPMRDAAAVVVAVQPNVIPDFERPAAELRMLFNRHLALSAEAFRRIDADPDSRELPRVVIFPESPMNFRYATDAEFRERIGLFAARHRTSVLFNSLEPTPAGGGYNSAVLVDEGGRLVEQYDKIGLLAFGEYVPLPSWLPGREYVRGVVGEFTPGERFALMPLGTIKAGVFICFESTLPHIARRFAEGGAAVLVNISNDAYQGRTAVLRQHLANSVFRAVENDRELLRVTNTGITARITPRGDIVDSLPDYTPGVRAWTVSTEASRRKTFYTIYGDVFAVLCVVAGVALYASTTHLFCKLVSARFRT